MFDGFRNWLFGKYATMKKNRLVVVQNRPTQFDVPLYAALTGSDDIDVTVFYTVVRPDEEDAIDAEIGIPPQWDHLSGLRYDARFERSAISIWWQMVAMRPDYVIICGWHPRSHALLTLLLRCSGISLGVRSDNTLEHSRLTGVPGLLKRLFMPLLLYMFKSWHPVGELARGYLEAFAWVRRPVFYFSYAVDVDWFRKQSLDARESRVAARRKLGLEPDDYVVFGLMKWSEREDPITLIEGFLQAAIASPRLKLVLVGDGALRYTVMSYLKLAPGRWVTPGYVKYSELPGYYALSDVFVHPARSEPYGVSVQEAVACGLPVLASTGVGAAREFIEPDINGDIFPAGDAGHLAMLLRKWADRSDASGVSTVSLSKAETWSYRRTLEELRSCLGQRQC